jgi:hypothetical protein
MALSKKSATDPVNARTPPDRNARPNVRDAYQVPRSE